MRRKVFLPFFLAVMLLPAIVLAQSTKLPKQGEKSRNVTAPGLRQAADQDWIILLGGQSREFKADTDGKLHFPVSLKVSTPNKSPSSSGTFAWGRGGTWGSEIILWFPDQLSRIPSRDR